VPDTHFNAVTLDFIRLLPEEDDFNSVLTITNALSVDIWLIPVNTSYTAAQVAVVLFDDWYYKNGLMLRLISDQDSLFTSEI